MTSDPPPPPPPSYQASRRLARVVLLDDARWLVFEFQEGYDRRGSSLIFESDAAVRRVRNYPENWRQLSDEALIALSNHS